MDSQTQLEQKIERLPAEPGVYLMKDESGEILYVGKAKNLRSRVRSYFRATVDRPKTALLVSRIRDLEWIVTDSETEALVLECNLIKEHRPRYNVMMIDDKHYPYVKVTTGETYPRVQIVRRRGADDARYFGPYTDVTTLNEVLAIIGDLFSLRTCANGKFRSRSRPCLNHQIKKCDAPCMGLVSPEDYRRQVDEVLLLLEGKTDRLLRRLKEEMDQASTNLAFERAARIRDGMASVRRLGSGQKMVSQGYHDRDILALATDGPRACGQIFFVRSGKVIGRSQMPLHHTEGLADGEIMGAFIKLYYSTARDLPGELLVSVPPEEVELLEDYLSSLRGKKVRIHHPRKGENRRLVEMVAENARLGILEMDVRDLKSRRRDGALKELQVALSLDHLPRRIECFDISNIGGSQMVASMVVFQDGEPLKSRYRRFKIRTVEGPNDFAAMEEVLGRRFSGKRDKDPAFLEMPDLVIIDGGKGQLSSARQVMHRAGVADIPTAGLAKKEELLFLEGRRDPVVLAPDAEARYLVQRIRDEAHRFAITFHRKLRGQEAFTSVLDSIPGIGPKRKKALLQAFGSPAGVRQASAGDIAAVLRISEEHAERIKEYL